MQSENKLLNETPHCLIGQNSANLLIQQQQLVIRSPHSATMPCSSSSTIPPKLNNENLTKNSAESNLCSKKSTDSIGPQNSFNYPQVFFYEEFFLFFCY